MTRVTTRSRNSSRIPMTASRVPLSRPSDGGGMRYCDTSADWRRRTRDCGSEYSSWSSGERMATTSSSSLAASGSKMAHSRHPLPPSHSDLTQSAPPPLLGLSTAITAELVMPGMWNTRQRTNRGKTITSLRRKTRVRRSFASCSATVDLHTSMANNIRRAHGLSLHLQTSQIRRQHLSSHTYLSRLLVRVQLEG